MTEGIEIKLSYGLKSDDKLQHLFFTPEEFYWECDEPEEVERDRREHFANAVELYDDWRDYVEGHDRSEIEFVVISIKNKWVKRREILARFFYGNKTLTLTQTLPIDQPVPDTFVCACADTSETYDIGKICLWEGASNKEAGASVERIFALNDDTELTSSYKTMDQKDLL